MIAYASRTGTKRNLAALREAGWRLMLSPAGEMRTEGFPLYSLDNGAWSAFSQKRPWDEAAFSDALERFGARSDFVVVPDIVLGGMESLDLSLAWLPRVLDASPVALIAVQNGMTPANLSGLLSERVGVFVGGDDAWKEATMGTWALAAHQAGAWCHVGRVNSQRRLRLCQMAGATSFDGSGPSRFEKHLRVMERGLAQRSFRLQGIEHAFSA
jgi:hypothetical protein